MTLKKSTSFASLLACMFFVMSVCAFTSCSPKKQLEKAVAEVNMDCPQNLGDGYVMEKVIMQNGNVVMVCNMSMSEDAIDDLRMVGSELCQAILISEIQSTADDDVRQLIKTMRKAHAKLIYRYVDYGDTFDVVIDPNDINI